jgi:hypothetical protein
LSGALTIAVGTSGSNIAVNSSSTTITINIPTATASARGALASADFTTFNNKIGRTFTNSNTITFDFDIFYITTNVTLPVVSAGDVGKVICIKNTDTTANRRVTAAGSVRIDDNVTTYVELSYKTGSNVQGAVTLQAISTTEWRVISAFGAITYG